MKITRKMLSIPPHVSTAWRNVLALRVEEDFESPSSVLVVQLADGTEVRVPSLSRIEIEAIFEAHARYLECGAEEERQQATQPTGFQGLADHMSALPFRIGVGGVEGLGAAMMHDSNQRGAPDLPPDILSKVGQIAQMLVGEAAAELPEPEVGCNCFHCQIARAIQAGMGKQVEEEEVSDDDLTFRGWDIRQVADRLYIVADPVDSRTQYSVFLGCPVGCTCGVEHCEHIQAVLRS